MRTRIFLLIFIFILKPGFLISQDRKTIKNKFLEAEYFFLRGAYHESAFLYRELTKLDPNNFNYQFLTGASYLSIVGEKGKAIPFLEKAITSISPGYREGSYRETDAPKEALFALAKAYHINEQLDKAMEYYTKYKNVMRLSDVAEIEYVNKQIESVKLAAEFTKDTLSFDFVELKLSEPENLMTYNPVFAPGDSLLLYMLKKPYYDAVMLTRKENNQWSIPENITPMLKTDMECQITSVSYDGNILLLSCNDGFQTDIYISYRKGNSWNPVKPLGEPINSIYNENHASLSKDTKTLYFTSDRPLGHGGMDIYSATRKIDGKWDNVQNLGEPVNSLYSEESPYISSDNKKLYFSSMSHATIGGFDIFISERLPDNSWSYPANIGYPISSCDDDLFYFPLKNGNQAIYSNNIINPETDRIIFLNMKEPQKNWKYAFKGKIETEDNKDLSQNTRVTFIDRELKDTLASIIPDMETGEYDVNLPQGNYDIMIESQGYDSISGKIMLNSGISSKNIHLKNKLRSTRVSEGEYMISKNILFDFDSYALSEDSKFELEKLYSIMKDNTDIFIEVTGHADAIGSEEYNFRLSNNRSRAIVQYLTAKGISRERFISKAVGESENIAINYNPDGTDNPEGRKFNRQVEINLVNNSQKNIWLEEYLVPERLKPAATKNYYVILDESESKLATLPENNAGDRIKLFETGRKHIYAAGSFKTKTGAIEYLNELVDSEFPQGRVVNEKEFTYLLEPSVPNLDEVKGPFTIQLLALRDPVDLDYFTNPSGIRMIKNRDGFSRYFTDIYMNYTEAQENLVKYVLDGFTDAFILEVQHYNNDSLNINQSFSPPHPQHYFTIQFSATRKPADMRQFQRLNTEILVRKGSDGFYRYSSGIFLNKFEAEKKLMIIKDAGFQDAFIKIIYKEKSSL